MAKIKKTDDWTMTSADFWTGDGDCVKYTEEGVTIQIMDSYFTPDEARNVAKIILKCANLAEGKEPQKGK